MLYYLKFDFKELLLSLIPVWEDVTVREPFYLFRETFIHHLTSFSCLLRSSGYQFPLSV